MLFSIVLLSFSQAGAGNLNAFFSLSTFNSPDKGPYVETYLHVVGNSVKLIKDIQGKFQGKVEVELTFTQAGEIKYHDKYNLLGPVLDDSSVFRTDFIDQQRILLPNGDYDLAIKISDKFSPEQSFSAHRPVKVYFPKDTIAVSDIELVASSTKATEDNNFTKSGLNIIPLVSDYYPQVLTAIKFYAEIYNTKAVLKDEPFIINYFISDHDNKYIAHNLASFKRETPDAVCVIMTELPITDLLSGNYDLTIEVRNKNNALLATKQVFFQRSNSKPVVQSTGDVRALDVSSTFVSYILNKDTMKDYIESVRPISSRNEDDFADNELQIADLKYMQQFFYDFWVKRNSSNPEKAWRDYLLEVKKVNAVYSTRTMRGYATDRGRVYLQYGPPNSITKEENEPAAYPYEIWHYYKLANQSNRKFLFYCHEPASNIYTLLHSDAIGEVYNERWEIDLYSRTNQAGTDFDQTTVPDHYGKKAEEDFNNPK